MAQKTDIELTDEAIVIRDETAPEGNTTERIYDMFKDIIDSKVNNNSGGGGGGGMLQRSWKFSTLTNAIDPGNGTFRCNNSVIASITEIYFSQTSSNSIDVEALFGILEIDQRIIIQQNNDSNRLINFKISGVPVDNGSWWTIPVEVVKHENLLFENNEACLVVFDLSTGGGSPDLSLYMVKSANLSDVTDVTAARVNLGLGNVNNTADIDKPVSTAQSNADNAVLAAALANDATILAQAKADSWSRATGATLTGVNTITSNAVNQLIFNGVWAQTANDDTHIKIDPTITSITGGVSSVDNSASALFLKGTYITLQASNDRIGVLKMEPTFSLASATFGYGYYFKSDVGWTAPGSNARFPLYFEDNAANPLFYIRSDGAISVIASSTSANSFSFRSNNATAANAIFGVYNSGSRLIFGVMGDGRLRNGGLGNPHYQYQGSYNITSDTYAPNNDGSLHIYDSTASVDCAHAFIGTVTAIATSPANAVRAAFMRLKGSISLTAFPGYIAGLDLSITVTQTTSGGPVYDIYANQVNTLATGGAQYGIAVLSTLKNNGLGTATPTAVLDIAASNTTRASFRIRSGIAPTTPNDGDIWFDNSNLYIQISGVTKPISTFWRTVPGNPTRSSSTTLTITDTNNSVNLYDQIISRGTVLKWIDSGIVKMAMVVSATYSTNTVTITIMGDVLNATATMSTFNYTILKAQAITFAIAGTMGTGTDLSRKWKADKSYRVFGADCLHGTAGATNATTYDINKNGSTIFTTKVSIASGVTVGNGNTADDGVSLALDDVISIDCDSVSTTPPVDAYIDLFIFPTNNQYL